MNEVMEVASKVNKEEWYKALVDDCKSIITENEFTARWAVVECYHQLGKRIIEENDKFERGKIYGGKIAQCIAESLGKSERTINYAVTFAKKFPSLDQLPCGKNVSWFQITQKYLPEISKDKEEKAGKLKKLLTIEGWTFDAITWMRDVVAQEPVEKWSSEKKKAIKKELQPIVDFYLNL